MDDLLDELARAAHRCERVARRFEETDIQERQAKLGDAINSVAVAWSGSWAGYQSRVYLNGLRPRRPGERWSVEWGAMQRRPNPTAGDWAEYDPQEILQAIEARAQLPPDKLAPLEAAAAAASREFDAIKEELLPFLDAVLAENDDKVLRSVREEITNLQSHFNAEDLAQAEMPKEIATRDTRAIADGSRVPPHVQIQAQLLEQLSYGHHIAELGKKIRYLQKYCEKRLKMTGKSIAKTTGKIFIGHGRSPAWRDLKDFIQDRLRLEWDEYNREPTAGLSTKERLQQMLDVATFAFLVMTAEDEQADGKRAARSNVIHEVGLFQGRLGFERAIVLLEDGCEEFSNITGLTQIRFPKGNITAKFEELRRVLEREKLL